MKSSIFVTLIFGGTKYFKLDLKKALALLLDWEKVFLQKKSQIHIE